MKAMAVVLLAALALPGTAGAQPLVANVFSARILAAHNATRAALGLPALVWDSSLAAGAAAWVERIASTGLFEHSDRHARHGIGENLWYGTHGAYGPEAMVGTWASERRNFVPGIFPSVSRTGNWYDVSHYTQVIWPATRRVGCALATNLRNDYLVCRYSPAGNIDGRFVP